MKRKIKRKEILAAAILSIVIVLSVAYVTTKKERQYVVSLRSCNLRSSEGYSELTIPGSTQPQQQSSKVISETIEGELERGAFEYVVNKLEILTEEMDGYVKLLRMTYKEEAWTGFMTCKVPPSNVTSFTFSARAIIDENGTVTYINISVEHVEQSQQVQESTYSTITFNLQEVKPEKEVPIGASLAPVLSVLTTSLWWIAQGVIIGIPLCFASLGIVILVSRGIIPLWKNTLKKPK
ncbi:hypothetical protein DRO44_02650 [Candidatus Bathyarchaeota archaeon]|nr:MAG: hypothetical protein DRO44_02650 [Candidatus Bathyarchaeota archaeon]